MEGKSHLFEKPAAGATRIWILYRSPPLENDQNFRKGGSVGKPSDLIKRIPLEPSSMMK